MASSRARQRRLIWYYFLLGDRPETSPVQAKLRQGLRSIVGEDGMGVVSVSVVCEQADADCEGSRRTLEDEFDSINTRIGDTLIRLNDR